MTVEQPMAARMPVSDRSLDDRREFEAAYRDVSRSAFLLARQLGRGTDEALDIVQNAALRAWRYRSTRTGEFRPWFLAIVYRQSRSHVPSWVPLPASWDPAAPDPIATSLDAALVAAMRELPGRQRAALWLRYCEDMAIRDVARIIGCSEPAAKQLLMRGREALRQKLQSSPKEYER
jgi:DNA-directed RNA polymerase specialized sigma24 family protein